jgi:hypothetical protein
MYKAGECEEIMQRLDRDDSVRNLRLKRIHQTDVLLRGNSIAKGLKAFAQHIHGLLNVLAIPALLGDFCWIG